MKRRLLLGAGMVRQEDLEEQARMLGEQNLRENSIFEGHKLWTLKEEDLLEIRYLFALVCIICPAHFNPDCVPFPDCSSADFTDF